MATEIDLLSLDESLVRYKVEVDIERIANTLDRINEKMELLAQLLGPKDAFSHGGSDIRDTVKD